MNSAIERMPMKGPKNDPDAQSRELLEPLADRFVRATPERRRQAVADMLPYSAPEPMRLLAEILVKRLDSKNPKVCAGAAATLALLGPHVIQTIHWALVAKPTGRRLLHLAPVAAALGRNLSATERTKLQMMLFIAQGLAPTLESRAAVGAALGSLRDQQFAEFEAQNAEDRKREAELLARYSAPRRKTGDNPVAMG
jgi:hypothetical protein